ncbi:type-2 ice-structuring protein isoform X1 [Magallana gigas]|uniref:type-2 ice-structuring protein isoform X1 n=1 Tax=Magallana gigas TaxID=29159 RepID=UPI0033415F63
MLCFIFIVFCSFVGGTLINASESSLQNAVGKRSSLINSTCASRLDCNQHNTNVLILFFTIHCPVDNIDCVDNKCLCTIDKITTPQAAKTTTLLPSSRPKLATTSASSSISTDCPRHWIRHQDSCYLFLTSNPMQWTGAMSFCKSSYDAQLAEIETSEENEFIRQESRKMAGTASGSFWIGGSDMLVEGEWEWMTSHNLVTFTDWASGEPDDFLNQDCLDIKTSAHYHWNDSPCSYLHWFICEKHVQPARPDSIIG